MRCLITPARKQRIANLPIGALGSVELLLALVHSILQGLGLVLRRLGRRNLAIAFVNPRRKSSMLRGGTCVGGASCNHSRQLRLNAGYFAP